jgi:glycosyltransferase involved in cell wall biosynthesis
MSRSLRALAGPQVTVHGQVADVEPFFSAARVFVAPLRFGSGVKGKINQSMSYGLPVVATPLAVEGMSLAAGENVLVAADPAAFAAQVVRLYRDADLWRRLSAAGIENIRQCFCVDAARNALARILRPISVPS